jgi:hypothetical protein
MSPLRDVVRQTSSLNHLMYVKVRAKSLPGFQQFQHLPALHVEELGDVLLIPSANQGLVLQQPLPMVNPSLPHLLHMQSPLQYLHCDRLNHLQ